MRFWTVIVYKLCSGRFGQKLLGVGIYIRLKLAFSQFGTYLRQANQGLLDRRKLGYTWRIVILRLRVEHELSFLKPVLTSLA